MADVEEWVIWNGTLGILDMVTIDRIEHDGQGRSAYLSHPYGAVGPFSFDELESIGRITFGACLVMSRQRWKLDQVDLRREARKKRLAYLNLPDPGDDREHREALDLPLEGVLLAAEINSAFRRIARIAHPDAGGSNEHYRRIAQARDELLQRIARAS